MDTGTKDLNAGKEMETFDCTEQSGIYTRGKKPTQLTWEIYCCKTICMKTSFFCLLRNSAYKEMKVSSVQTRVGMKQEHTPSHTHTPERPALRRGEFLTAWIKQSPVHKNCPQQTMDTTELHVSEKSALSLSETCWQSHQVRKPSCWQGATSLVAAILQGSQFCHLVLSKKPPVASMHHKPTSWYPKQL